MKHKYNPHVDRKKVKGLSESVVKRLDKLAETESKKHIDIMVKHLKAGKTFKKAHEMAVEEEKKK